MDITPALIGVIAVILWFIWKQLERIANALVAIYGLASNRRQ